MKTKIFLFTIISLLAFTTVQAQTEEIIIQTSGQCLQCKTNIEKGLMAEKGVKMAQFDMNSKKVKVVYNAKRTDPETIRKTISAIGYDADDVKADPAGIEKLAPCCRPGGHNE